MKKDKYIKTSKAYTDDYGNFHFEFKVKNIKKLLNKSKPEKLSQEEKERIEALVKHKMKHKNIINFLEQNIVFM